VPLIGGAMPFSEEGQKLFSRLKSAVAAKVLIQTGVAARPEEVETQVKSYIANWKTHPEAAMDEFDRLIKFYKDYTKLAETKKGSSFETKNNKKTAKENNVVGKYKIIGIE
jgi:hypothetical protein